MPREQLFLNRKAFGYHPISGSGSSTFAGWFGGETGVPTASPDRHRFAAAAIALKPAPVLDFRHERAGAGCRRAAHAAPVDYPGAYRISPEGGLLRVSVEAYNAAEYLLRRAANHPLAEVTTLADITTAGVPDTSPD